MDERFQQATNMQPPCNVSKPCASFSFENKNYNPTYISKHYSCNKKATKN
jgi:hypothetical protein